jgi:hypothetical protein
MKSPGYLILAVALGALIAAAACTGVPGGETTPKQTTLPLLTPTQPGGPALVPGPIQTMPADQTAIFQINKDPINAQVRVIYQGGTAGVHVRTIQVRFTKADGTVEDRAFVRDIDSPSFKMGQEVIFTGTHYTDRVEVTVGLDNGKSYKVVDQLVPYQVRP